MTHLSWFTVKFSPESHLTQTTLKIMSLELLRLTQQCSYYPFTLIPIFGPKERRINISKLLSRLSG